MSDRRPFNANVNTGGEAGQIIDHLLCSSDQKERYRDAQDLIKLIDGKDAEIAKLRSDRDAACKALDSMRLARDAEHAGWKELRELWRERD